ncbi:MAG: hypothetical protein GY811_29865 [Myxococcales bacterium]|nr:hypothetical protein [Myxococcales bacterium]
MRDPDRIPVVLKRIREVWEQDPDLRLGQLILIACQNKTAVWPDVFSVEDEALLEGLEEYVAQLEQVNIGLPNQWLRR